ncbi:MAG: protein-tyrosine phosphatase family protein [Candidatus Dormibacteria bacterium]
MTALATPYQRSYWVSPGRLLAGHYPGAANSDEASHKLDGLVAASIRHVVNLMEEGERDRSGAIFVPYEAPLKARGISMTRMPIRDFHIPSEDEMVTILDDIDQSITAGTPTYVHCWGGKGRTGTVVGCWLVRHGIAAPERAVDRIKELQAVCGGNLSPSPESETQRAFVRTWKAGQ